MGYRKYGTSTQIKSIQENKVLDILNINENVIKISVLNIDKFEESSGFFNKSDIPAIINALKHYQKRMI
jgi:hypothetical protein